MIEIRCPICMKLYPLHLEHEHKSQCAQKSRPARKPTTSPVAKTAASNKNSPSSRRIVTPSPEPVTTRPVITRNYEQSPQEPDRATEVARVTQWRAENREHYNAYMRAWRARQKAPE